MSSGTEGDISVVVDFLYARIWRDLDVKVFY